MTFVMSDNTITVVELHHQGIWLWKLPVFPTAETLPHLTSIWLSG